MAQDSQPDLDRQETQEWLDSLEAVLAAAGPERAHYLLEKLIAHARTSGLNLPYRANTAYHNTIPPSQEAGYPGNPEIENRLRAYARWNAMATVVRANRKEGDLGGHIASFASSSTLYDVGINHYFRVRHPELKGTPHENCGDLVYVQGHSSPGIYARSFLEGRLSAEQLDSFRQEVGGQGLSSYPHPWLMPDYWQFPTVSMGLGPIMAIYQARFMRYLEHRELLPATDRKVWAFLGDGECDEPESLGAISLASRERLDNLIFVVNCNLQRLDGPVRGNGKIIQELEAVFHGAGWNVIKVVWGTNWDSLLMQDADGELRELMEQTVDGDYQTFRAENGGYIRENFFGKYPKLKQMVASMTDSEIYSLRRGGHDLYKVNTAYRAAIAHRGQPTVILAKTIKGYGMGDAGEAKNIAHQQKKISDDALRRVRDRFRIPIRDDQIAEVPYYAPPADSTEAQYLAERVKAMGGSFPFRNREHEALPVPGVKAFAAQTAASGERSFSTTMAFVRILSTLLKEKQLGPRLVPIVADESRTFGMEGLFRQLGIYSLHGQRYRPEDADQLMYYREDRKGQILQEGISEAGSLSSWIAAATAYSNHGLSMVPFFIFYSMFGFQRIGDLAWAAGDSRARGFLLGATSGRTTLNGEGLQHEDGHSHVLASVVPNCVSYDPTYAGELAVIIQDGLRRMVADKEDVYYYITLMNENYPHPEVKPAQHADLLKGMYLRKSHKVAKATGEVQLLGSGSILREVEAAAEMLAAEHKVASQVWSATSFNLLARDGRAVARRNLLKMGSKAKPERTHVQVCLDKTKGPVVAASDYVKLFTEQLRAYLPEGRNYRTLGTDGFGRSDTRANLRRHFEVSRNHIAYAALASLAEEGAYDPAKLRKVAKAYGIDPGQADPIGA
ncbi:MAG: pyruvate dehydrogenase (acetyl-transferring), homodimeric type [Betaproteobacteria bacterium AqS2]|uniref:Pyruvate dehydrogenase E1 component n=1 Tax=Candidatus Amphirhobacter heronislandensis TaxID=1732024 RepID=A0A930UH79_9GAMM|nr:pyruvate dehydrogenase (acetyl-transferring), homodimeric type [Betaproteobacteria bacterium AqS2]